MKVKRFITEYANYQKESINSNELIRSDIKEKALNRIDGILNASRRGMITIDESMKAIADVITESI